MKVGPRDFLRWIKVGSYADRKCSSKEGKRERGKN